MPKRTSDFREGLLADLADPTEAANYLNAALEDSERMALVALRDVAEARQMARVAKEAGVAREALYRMLSETGNPTFGNLSAILKSVGLKLEVAPISHTFHRRLKAPEKKLASNYMHASGRTSTGKKSGRPGGVSVIKDGIFFINTGTKDADEDPRVTSRKPGIAFSRMNHEEADQYFAMGKVS